MDRILNWLVNKWIEYYLNRTDLDDIQPKETNREKLERIFNDIHRE
jgi:hypothetical protein